MLDDNKIRSIIYKMQAGLLQWGKSYRPDLIRCGLQASDKNVESKDIKRAIVNSLINELHLSRRVIAYFSNPYQKHLADRLTAEIEKVNYIGSFDARQKNITIYYLPTILEIKSALDDCLAAIPCQQAKSLTNHSGGKAGGNKKTKYPLEVREKIFKLKDKGETWKEIAKQLNQLYPNKKYKVNALKKWYSKQNK